jgi:L-asparaginase II
MNSMSSLVVEITRGNAVESRHQVDAVIADAEGSLVSTHGDADRETYPRSSIKALQALPLVESGAADNFGFEPRHLALACASHHGEKMHTETACEMLAAAGLTLACLECGAQMPAKPEDMQQLAREVIPVTAIHNNCSGKHSGFLVFAVQEGFVTSGYVKIDHPVQREIAGTLEAITSAKHGEDNHGIDGCSIPTYRIPLENLAKAYAKFGVGDDVNPGRSTAMLRLRDACMAHPEMVAGTDAFDTRIMTALKGRVFTKTGAEGVFTVAIPELSLGMAIKCHDGTTRAAEAACASLIQNAFLESESELSQTELTALKKQANPIIKNRMGLKVGEVHIAQ